MAGRVNGVLIPLVTPFIDGRVDIDAYKRLLLHYLGTGIHGLVPRSTGRLSRPLSMSSKAKSLSMWGSAATARRRPCARWRI